MERRIAVLAGGSGFIGGHLRRDLQTRGYAVRQVGRSGPDARWDDEAQVRQVVDGADLVINLAGRSVGCRYTDRHRQEILRSRTETTAALRRAIAAADAPPRLWLNASTGTIYRHAEDHPQTERDGELGQGFSVDVARSWEEELFADELPGTRRVALRMAIVLGDGSALQMLARAARLGLGGPQLDGWWPQHRRYRGIGPHPTPAASTRHRSRGQQRFSWLHIDDLHAIVAFLDEHDEIEGPVNCAAPQAPTNRGFMSSLRRAVGAPVGLPAARWMIEPGMLVLRQEPELVLKSRWVAPERLLEAGFTFTWTDLDRALADLL